VADVIDTHSTRVPPTWQPVFAGAAANGAPADLRSSARQNSPATRAMRLSRTAPQPVVPEEPTTGVWPAGPAGHRDGYTGTFDTQAYDPGGYGQADGRSDTGPNRIRDTASFERPDGFPGHEDDLFGPEGDDRGRRGGSHRARHGRYDDGDDDYGRPGKRRWPIVTGALVLLVILIAGGGYGFWRYNQNQYYVGIDKNGNVSVFRGTNQSLVGINLSSLYSESALKASMLTASDQAALTQTISQGSASDAHQKINQLAGEATQCRQTYQELAAWQRGTLAYQSYLTAKAKAVSHKAKPPAPVANPGPMPTQLPDADTCAPSTVFGVPAASLPTSGESAPAATPSSTPTKPASTPTKSASAKASPTVTAATTPPAAG
jgi:hypothetical protein